MISIEGLSGGLGSAALESITSQLDTINSSITTLNSNLSTVSSNVSSSKNAQLLTNLNFIDLELAKKLSVSCKIPTAVGFSAKETKANSSFMNKLNANSNYTTVVFDPFYVADHGCGEYIFILTATPIGQTTMQNDQVWQYSFKYSFSVLYYNTNTNKIDGIKAGFLITDKWSTYGIYSGMHQFEAHTPAKNIYNINEAWLSGYNNYSYLQNAIGFNIFGRVLFLCTKSGSYPKIAFACTNQSNFFNTYNDIKLFWSSSSSRSVVPPTPFTSNQQHPLTSVVYALGDSYFGLAWKTSGTTSSASIPTDSSSAMSLWSMRCPITSGSWSTPNYGYIMTGYTTNWCLTNNTVNASSSKVYFGLLAGGNNVAYYVSNLLKWFTWDIDYNEYPYRNSDSYSNSGLPFVDIGSSSNSVIHHFRVSYNQAIDAVTFGALYTSNSGSSNQKTTYNWITIDLRDSSNYYKWISRQTEIDYELFGLLYNKQNIYANLLGAMPNAFMTILGPQALIRSIIIHKAEGAGYSLVFNGIVTSDLYNNAVLNLENSSAYLYNILTDAEAITNGTLTNAQSIQLPYSYVCSFYNVNSIDLK